MSKKGEKIVDVDIKKEFTKKQLEEVNRIIGEYKCTPGSLIPVLEKVQGVLGFLPIPIQEIIARGLGVSKSQVFGVVTFYSFFTMNPRGRHSLRVCLGTACYVRGGKKVAERIESDFKILDGETTEDRRFSYEKVRCLGACGLAPVIVIDDKIHKQVKPLLLNNIIKEYD
jgi:NADH:ubiquinone oxidoreductase subunit E